MSKVIRIKKLLSYHELLSPIGVLWSSFLRTRRCINYTHSYLARKTEGKDLPKDRSSM